MKIRDFPLFLALFKHVKECQKTIKIDKNWFNDMVLGWFNPHFNLGAIVRSSTRPEKTKILYFLCFCDCFFFSLKKWKSQ